MQLVGQPKPEYVSGNEARGLLKVAVLNHQQRLKAVEHGYEAIILPFCVSTAYLLNKATFWVRLKWLLTGRFTLPAGCPVKAAAQD